MDLKEQSFKDYSRRHPWELVRLKFFTNLLKNQVKTEGAQIVDLGAGDCWFGSELAGGLLGDPAKPPSICFVDKNFNPETQEILNKLINKNIKKSFQTDITEKIFDVALMLDVLEHVEDDSALLKTVVSKCFGPNTLGFISVPAFQMLYGEHDSELGHFRRYSGTQGKKLVESSGLKILQSGYLFSSLMLPRLADNFLGLLISRKGKGTRLQVPERVSMSEKLMRLVLESDLATEALFNYKLPGLTWWAVCKKR